MNWKISFVVLSSPCLVCRAVLSSLPVLFCLHFLPLVSDPDFLSVHTPVWLVPLALIVFTCYSLLWVYMWSAFPVVLFVFACPVKSWSQSVSLGSHLWRSFLSFPSVYSSSAVQFSPVLVSRFVTWITLHCILYFQLAKGWNANAQSARIMFGTYCEMISII